MKHVHNAKKNRYSRTHFSFFLATPYLLCYPLQSFGGKFEIVNFYKQLDFYMVPLKFVCKIHRHYYSKCKLFDGLVKLQSRKIHAKKQFLAVYGITSLFGSKMWNPVHTWFPQFLQFHMKSHWKLPIFHFLFELSELKTG